jgi:hypothetical protein
MSERLGRECMVTKSEVAKTETVRAEAGKSEFASIKAGPGSVVGGIAAGPPGPAGVQAPLAIPARRTIPACRVRPAPVVRRPSPSGRPWSCRRPISGGIDNLGLAGRTGQTSSYASLSRTSRHRASSRRPGLRSWAISNSTITSKRSWPSLSRQLAPIRSKCSSIRMTTIVTFIRSMPMVNDESCGAPVDVREAPQSRPHLSST